MQKIPAEMRQISEMYFLTFLFVLSVEGLMNINKDILVIFRFLSCLTLLTPLFSFFYILTKTPHLYLKILLPSWPVFELITKLNRTSFFFFFQNI